MRIVKRRSGVVRVSLSASSPTSCRPSWSLTRSSSAARAAGVAGGAAADGHGVRALRIEVEQGVEGGHGVDLRLRDAGAQGHVLERLHRQVLVPVVLLELLQDAEQRARPAGPIADDAVDQVLVFRVRRSRRRCVGHRILPGRTCSAGRCSDSARRAALSRAYGLRRVRAVGPSGPHGAEASRARGSRAAQCGLCRSGPPRSRPACRPRPVRVASTPRASQASGSAAPAGHLLAGRSGRLRARIDFGQCRYSSPTPASTAQPRGIAERIAERLRAAGLTAEALPVGDAGDVKRYDAVILGSALYMFHWTGRGASLRPPAPRRSGRQAAVAVQQRAVRPRAARQGRPRQADQSPGRASWTSCAATCARATTASSGAPGTRANKPIGFWEKMVHLLPGRRAAEHARRRLPRLAATSTPGPTASRPSWREHQRVHDRPRRAAQ